MTERRNMTLKCRRCKCLPKRIVEEGRRDMICCPTCGIHSDLDEALNLARTHAARSVSHGEIRAFQKRQAAGVKGAKNITYRPGTIPTLTPPAFVFE